MKPSLTLLIAAASAFAAAFALAEDDRQPPAPEAAEVPVAAVAAVDAAAPATPPAPPDTPAPPPPAASAAAPSATPPPAPDQPPPNRREGRPGRHGPADTGFLDGGRSQDQKPPGDGPQHPGAAEHSERGPGGEQRARPQPPGEDRHDAPPGGWRGPDGASRSGGPGHEQRPPMPPMPPPKPMPFIGVVTSPVPPPLAAQLGLLEDFGLIVDAVMPNSPAATAGLQKFDVLKLYNDQQIVDVRQLAILVRATGKDGSASLTIIRKAQEQKISIKVGEHMMPNLLGGARPPGDTAHGPGPHGFSFMHPGSAHPQFANQDFARHHTEQPDPNRGDGNPRESRRPGSDRERFAQDHSERHQRSEGPDADREGHGHHGFDHRRFAHERFERGGRDQEGRGHADFAHERSGRTCHQHHHHSFAHRNRHHGFGHEGSNRGGSDHRWSHWTGFHHHRGHHRHEFARPGSDHHGFEREHFHRGGFDHERFAGDDHDRKDGERQGWHHGSRDQTREHGGFNHSQPSDRAGRRPDVRGPSPENRDRDFQKRTEDGHHHSSIDSEEQPSELQPLQPANLLREIRPGGAAEIRITQPAGTVVYDTANARVQFSDGAMKIEIVTKEGHRTLRATDLEGGILFEGALETAEQVKSVPEDIRKKLNWIETRSRTEVVTAPAQEIPAERESASSSLDCGSLL